MKRINKIFSLMIGLMVLLVSCDSIVEEQYLENTKAVEEVELVVNQPATGSNQIEFNMLTPGVTGYWDYIIGKGLTDRITVTFPVTGTFDFNYVGTLGAEFFEKSVSVTIDTLDHEVPSEWTALLGDDAVAGKTWVFDGSGGDGGLWWFMSPLNEPDSYMSVWWNAGGECCPPSDVNGKMQFDLDGAANYYYYSGPDASPVEGTFVLDLANRSLKINGANILGAEEGGANPSALYQIKELTEDRMVLYIPSAPFESAWTWVFRPE